MPKTILERGGFRFVESGVLENGNPDYRLQEQNEYTKRWSDVYYFDNQDQFLLAIEDDQYPRWLTGKTCYAKDTVRAQDYGKYL